MSLRGVWVSQNGMRKQNGHWQRSGSQTPSQFEFVTVPADGKIFSFEDKDTGTFTFGAPGYKTVDALSLLNTEQYEDWNGNIWTLEDWGEHAYKPDTGVFTVCRNNDAGYGPDWYWWYKISNDGTQRTIQYTDLGSGQINTIVRDWLCPTYHHYIFKAQGTPTVIGRAELDQKFGAGRILMNGPKYRKNIYTGYSGYYAATANNVPGLTGAINPDQFQATFIAPPLPTPWRYYNNNTNLVHACATEFTRRSGQVYRIDASTPYQFFQARETGSYHFDDIGGTRYIWVSVLKKLLITTYPMTT